MSKGQNDGSWFADLLETFMPDIENMIISGTPEDMIKKAGWEAFAVSTAASLPGGPLGYAAIIPELVTVTKIQINLVAAIAKYYGKASTLNGKMMLIIFAQEAGVYIGREVLEKMGGKLVVKGLTSRIAREIAKKVGAKIGSRVVTKLAARWVPVILAPIFGQFSRAMTESVGREAIKVFKEEIVMEEDKVMA